MFTGTFNSISRDEAKYLAKEKGGLLSDNSSQKAQIEKQSQAEKDKLREREERKTIYFAPK